MATDPSSTPILVTIDEIGPDQEDNQLATLVTDDGDILTVPVRLLPEGSRVGDVLTMTFGRDPDERERRRRHIADMQRRLFGSG